QVPKDVAHGGPDVRFAGEAVAELVRAVAAFEFQAPVRVELVAEAGEADPVALQFDVAGAQELGVEVRLVGPVVAEVARAVPTVRFGLSGPRCEHCGESGARHQFQFHIKSPLLPSSSTGNHGLAAL